jgi:hypothetical protein
VMLPPIPTEESVDKQVIRHCHTVGLLCVPLDNLHVRLCLVGCGKARPCQAQLRIPLGAGPGVASATKTGEKVKVLPPRNDVVKCASMPTNKTFPGADKQNPRNNSMPEASDRRSEIRIGTSQRAASLQPGERANAQPRNISHLGEEDRGRERQRREKSPLMDCPNHQDTSPVDPVGHKAHHGCHRQCVSLGKVGLHRRCGKPIHHRRADWEPRERDKGRWQWRRLSRRVPNHKPHAAWCPPPASQCESPMSLTVQPRGGRGATWESRSCPPESISPPQTKKTWGTSQARQYVVTRQETKGSKRRSRKTTSKSMLHWCGVATRIKAPGQTILHNSTNGPSGKRIDKIRNLKAVKTANQRLDDAPRILHNPKASDKEGNHSKEGDCNDMGCLRWPANQTIKGSVMNNQFLI